MSDLRWAIRMNLDDQPEFAMLLGVCIARWAYAEEALSHILALLLQINEENAEIIFYASKSEQLRAQIIRQLLNENVPEKETHTVVNNAISAFQNAAQKRNLYVHGLWKLDTQGRVGLTPTRSGPIDWFQEETPVSVDDLKSFAETLKDIEEGLINAHGQLRYTFSRRLFRQSRRHQHRGKPPK